MPETELAAEDLMFWSSRGWRIEFDGVIWEARGPRFLSAISWHNLEQMLEAYDRRRMSARGSA